MSAKAVDAQSLHSSLLRPAILQILRAAGFNAARPSVVDTLTSICAAYVHLLSTRVHAHALSNHNTLPPDITDVRLAMIDVGTITPSLTTSEEVWNELFAKLGGNAHGGNAEALDEVKQFAEWVHGAVVGEQKRIAGFTGDEAIVELEGQESKEDYVTILKKKHSKTGEESRFQGTIMGIEAEFRPISIDGGPATLHDWREQVRLKAAETAPKRQIQSHDMNGDGNHSDTSSMSDPIDVDG